MSIGRLLLLTAALVIFHEKKIGYSNKVLGIESNNVTYYSYYTNKTTYCTVVCLYFHLRIKEKPS